ncbi:flagellin-like protein [Allosphingosinicella vermicomposti]|uniref:flagellin N-terminal helical domain-containing protein n=1 Tax=Allosphingosinicella vermicomposti TaxID=614671 RepID=UPI000D0F5FBB|nr:flagellin-like protein [Allosphingosinicella vermicomposti]
MINATRYRLDAEINRQANLAKEITKLQTQISTGKRIQAPSDDAIASARITEIGRNQADEVAWKRNLGTAAALSDQAFSTLTALMATVDRAASLTSSANNGAASDEARKIYANEIRQLAAQITGFSEARDTRGEPLFRTIELEIPVATGLRLSPVALREEIFGPIETGADPMALSEILLAAADAMEIEDQGGRQAALTTALDNVNRAAEHVALVQGDHNVRGSRIAALEEQSEDTKLRLAVERDELELVDPFQAIAQLEATKLSLDAAQAIFARVNEKTLFDYLR